ncbi:hypothetical protein [Thioalkalivibrio sulfidiphilus]|uniref:AAA ATPase n=1 Tax=Thioalkalivibrio sulfidiphilus (strain HL-EbGR7) TaxID=396588 RepID=B8GLW2_THISH|nr:hypothetical protein [Thioalkalivibrio sulfidiphilus]ACL71715.1 AAA ATPase [Thioalkalivibrio sulfidiphilus HL-EbGr7]
MLIYTANKDHFIRDVLRNEYDDRILANMQARGLGGVSPAGRIAGSDFNK